jgi:hypothetical protein
MTCSTEQSAGRSAEMPGAAGAAEYGERFPRCSEMSNDRFSTAPATRETKGRRVSSAETCIVPCFFWLFCLRGRIGDCLEEGRRCY